MNAINIAMNRTINVLTPDTKLTTVGIAYFFCRHSVTNITSNNTKKKK